MGAVAGIPFGVVLKAYVHNEGGSEAGALAFPVAVGAGAGLAIDALLVRPRTVFERRVPPRTVVSIRVTRQSGGVRFTRLF
jgi:hypothetical protein